MPTLSAPMPVRAPNPLARPLPVGGDLSGLGVMPGGGSLSAPMGTLPNGLSAPTMLPQPAPPTPTPLPGYVPTNPGQFGGHAPTPTPYGDFTAPDPHNFQQDPSYQFRLGEGEKALQRSAAARGTLLSGGVAKALQNYGQDAASQEYGNAYNRALSTYTANRDTNAQNYGQLLGQFQGNLGAFNANTQAQLGYNNQQQQNAYGNYDRAYQQGQDQQGYQQAVNNTNAAQSTLGSLAQADAYAQAVAAQRAQQAAEAQKPLLQQARKVDPNARQAASVVTRR